MKQKILLLSLLMLGYAAGWSQSVKGLVYDAETGEPLIGAAVVLKGMVQGVKTDVSGSFALDYQGSFPVTVAVSFLGYAVQDVQYAGASEVRVALEPISTALGQIVVTSRRRKESPQEIPIPIAVISGSLLDQTGSFNVNRLKELAPSVQLYSSNPRNTTLNIRGLGSTFGLTNDGIEPGVGFYVDGVYYARPAATTIDFIDVERVEVLRGPQGTLFGRNTTAGALNIHTLKPSFETDAVSEVSTGNYGFVQARASVSGALAGDVLAARVSFTGTNRDGVVTLRGADQTDRDINTLNNTGIRAQLLFKPAERFELLLAGDYSRQRPDGYAQVFAGVAPTRRAAYRQFENIIADLGYDLPSRNAFDRLVDHDTPWKSNQDFGGASLNAEYIVGRGTLTSTTAWRFWNWDPSNDRDFTGLQGLRLSQAPSVHQQWSQEIRYAGNLSRNITGVFGVYGFAQHLEADGAHVEEAGRDQWRFSQNSTSALWQTPGLLDGYGIRSYPTYDNQSAAFFAQVDWLLFDRLSILPGIRANYDKKKVDFRREVYGGLQTDDPALIALQRTVYSNQVFQADIEDQNLSGQLTLALKVTDRLRVFTTYANSFKPVGLNLGGLPNKDGKPMVELAVILPERVNHLEFGLKSEPARNTLFNLTVFSTTIDDYQTLVQTADLAVNRGYLANAERVRVEGFELDAAVLVKESLRINAAVSYSDGKYVRFTNAPPPLEETGGPSFKDISGGQLPGISKWISSLGLEYTRKSQVLKQDGRVFIAVDGYYRSRFSSSPSPSAYLNIGDYALVNGRAGFRADSGVSFFLWARNLTDRNYFEQLLPGAGNAGHFAGVLGDPRTYGVTLRYELP